MPEQGIYADTHPADLMPWFRMKYSLSERKRRKSAEAEISPRVSDALIASMIIPPHYTFPAYIYSYFQFALWSSLRDINNLLNVPAH